MTRRLLFLLAVVLELGGCADDPRELRGQRAALVRQAYANGEEVHLGVVWSGAPDRGFFAGASLAAEELNADGGVAGRKLLLKPLDEAPFLAEAKIDRAASEGSLRNAAQEAGDSIAKAMLANPRVGAVVGHSDHGQTTLSAMAAYDANGVMLLSAGTLDDKVRWLGTDLYFQLLPSNKRFAAKLTDEIRRQHWNNVHIIYAHTRNNEQLVELIKADLANAAVTVSGSTALVGDMLKSRSAPGRLRNSLGELRAGTVDAVILLAPPDLGATVMIYARSLGIAQPFVGAMTLDSPKFVSEVGAAGADTIIVDVYRDNSYQQRRFAARFRARFAGQTADKWAALGYDSVRLYAQAVECAGTSDPISVAHALYFKLPVWVGVVGRYGFRHGDGQNDEMRFATKVLRRQPDGTYGFVFKERLAEDEMLAH